MRLTLWRRLRFLLRGRAAPGRRTGRSPLRGPGRGQPAGDALVEALLGLRRTIETERWDDLPLAWFRVDEAKAAATWYDAEREPAHPAILPEEEALAEQLFRAVTGRPVTIGNLLEPPAGALPMVVYRLLVTRLPMICATGGRRCAAAIRTAYEWMHIAPDVLSPYGRWLLARAVCLAARDREELARQTDRFRLITSDYRAADGASMRFVSGGDFELPLPISITGVLDWRGMPTRFEAIKRADAPKEIQRFFLRLTPRGQRVFAKAFVRRQEAYHHGYPWRKPPWLASEGYVFVKHPVHVPAYFIDRRPVTHEMFQDFAHRHPLWLPSRVGPHAVDRDTYLPGWNGDRATQSLLGEAVTGVSYQAARAYVAAFDKQLPTEAQWVYALIGPEVPETRHVGAEGRPSMTDEERAIYGRRAAERGLHVTLPERLYDFDGAVQFTAEEAAVLHNPRGPAHGPAHLWRTPTARGRVPDLAGDANLTYRGVIPAGRIWSRSVTEPSPPIPPVG